MGQPKNVWMIVIIIGVILIAMQSTKKEAVIAYQVNPGESMSIQGEFKVTGTTFTFVPHHIYWTLTSYGTSGTTAGNTVSSGDVALSSAEITALDNARICVINSGAGGCSQTLLKTFSITSPTTPAYYAYNAVIYNNLNQRITQIQLDVMTNSVFTAPDGTKLFQVLNTGQCEADYNTYNTISIPYGTMTITTYHDVGTNYPTCSESTSDTNWVVTCNAGYTKTGTGANQACSPITCPQIIISACSCGGATYSSGYCCNNIYSSTTPCSSCTPGFVGNPFCGADLSKIYKTYTNADCSQSTNVFSTCSGGQQCSGGVCTSLGNELCTDNIDNDGDGVINEDCLCPNTIVNICSCGGATYSSGYCCNNIYSSTTPCNGGLTVTSSAIVQSYNSILASFQFTNTGTQDKTFLLEVQTIFQADKGQKASSGAAGLCKEACKYNVHKIVTIAAGTTTPELVTIRIPMTGSMPNGEYFVQALSGTQCFGTTSEPFATPTIIQEHLLITQGALPISDLCPDSYYGDYICDKSIGENHITAPLDCQCTDVDGDGYGIGDLTECKFDIVDCDDTKGQVKPGGIEYCDSLDNDCDGEIDENCIAPSNDTCEGKCLSIIQECKNGKCVMSGTMMMIIVIFGGIIAFKLISGMKKK